MADAQMEMHYGTIVSALTDGTIIPFLGAGANLCDRPEPFQPGVNLPSGGELAAHLVKTLSYPPNKDLANLSQYIVVAGRGPAWLYQTLRGLFNRDYPPTLVHKLLAVLPQVWRETHGRLPFKIIVTTNYDDVLERAFFANRQPFDVLSYVADGADQGKFRHWSFDFEPEPEPAPEPWDEAQSEEERRAVVEEYERRLAEHHRRQEARREEFWASCWPPQVESTTIHRPNEYNDFAPDRRPVILKIHGAVNRFKEGLDSYVISEDDYIEYLLRTDISQFIPAVLAARMAESHFWFLGYSLRDWNLRVILRRIWGNQERKYNSWAVQLNPEHLEERGWSRRNVDIINRHLHEYAHGLIRHLKLLPHITELNRRLRGPQASTPPPSPPPAPLTGVRS